jgi:hypothetical protein
MTTFRLQKSPGSNAAITKFDVIDAADSIVGRISVPREEAADLEKHWLGGTTQPRGCDGARPRQTAKPCVSAMLAVARKNRLSKTAILRGC